MLFLKHTCKDDTVTKLERDCFTTVPISKQIKIPIKKFTVIFYDIYFLITLLLIVPSAYCVRATTTSPASGCATSIPSML